MEKVRIIAPSHVHVGNFDLHGGVGRLYGTIGFSLEYPRVVVEVSIDSEYRVDGGSRSSEVMDMTRKASKICKCGPLHVRVLEEIPGHVGLGSTTALALSIAHGVNVLCNAGLDVESLAYMMGRGSISALGVYSFKYGGFIIDGGFIPGQGRVPPLLFRAHVPSRYLMIVALPEKPIEDVLRIKSREEEILKSMPRMDEDMAMEASRIALMGIMAYVSDNQWIAAGKWITQFNRRLGEYWSAKQRGVYCCEEVEGLVETFLENGALLSAQSSWGPTVYGLVESNKAGHVASVIREKLEEAGGGRLWVTPVNNTGAIVYTT